MSFPIARRALALAALACSPLALAAPPATLSYHGSLETAAGAPVSSTLSITFRLYDAEAGGVALWDETSSVHVLDGRFAVTLGSTNPLPEALFANPVYLGLQVAGDAEMAPRLPLTAVPAALRARALLRNTSHVSADGTPQENAAALRQAVALASIAAADDNRQVVTVDAGHFDLGDSMLVVPPHVALEGAGPRATLLVGALSAELVQLSSDSALRRVGVANTGTGGDTANPNAAIGVADLAERVVLESVAATSAPPAGAQGTDVRMGLRLARVADLRVADSDITVARSATLFGVRAIGVWGSEPAGGALQFEDVRIHVSGASESARGLDVAGRMQVRVHGLDLHMEGGGVAVSDVVGFRTQLETALIAHDLDATLDYAASSPAQVRGLQFTRSERTDIEGFHLRVDTGSCAPGGFRNAVVFHNPPIASLLPQQPPRLRDGVVEVSAIDCFSGGIYSSGSAVDLDNVRVHAKVEGTTGTPWAIAYVMTDSNSQCADGPVQEGTTHVRHSSLVASATGTGFAGGMEQCVGTLEVEHSTLSGSHRGLTGGNNTVDSYAFDIRNSRLVGSTWEPLALFGDGTGSVHHTSLESTSNGGVAAFPDPESGVAATLSCWYVNTATTIGTGGACPCAGGSCPTVPTP